MIIKQTLGYRLLTAGHFDTYLLYINLKSSYQVDRDASLSEANDWLRGFREGMVYRSRAALLEFYRAVRRSKVLWKGRGESWI